MSAPDKPRRCGHVIQQNKVGRLRGSAIKCRQIVNKDAHRDGKCWRHTGQRDDTGRAW